MGNLYGNLYAANLIILVHHTQISYPNTQFSLLGQVLTLRERLRTHKVFTKDQCFYLNYHKFSIKSYVVDVYKNRLGEAILIHIKTYDFMEKYRNFSLFIILIPSPGFPHFYYMLGGNLGSLFYGDVSVMSVVVFSFTS